MADPTSPSLLERLRQQPIDSASWRRFVELYAAWLGAWVVRLARPAAGGSPVLAGEQDQEEVVRNVLLLISREADAVGSNGRPGGFRASLRKTFVDCLRDHIRKKGATVESLDQQLAQLIEPGSTLSQAFDQEHQAHVVD